MAAISAASATVGFLCGSAHSERQSRCGQDEPPLATSNSEARDEYGSSDDDEDSNADGDLSMVSAGLLQPCKLVRVLSVSTCMSTFCRR